MIERMYMADVVEFPSRPQLEVGFAQTIVKYEDVVFWNRSTDLLAILDGSTGLRGAKAGASAARVGHHVIDTHVEKGLADTDITQEGAATALLEEAFRHAHAVIREEPLPHEDDLEGGTAAAAAVLIHNLQEGDPGFSWAAVGDVLVEVFHDGSLEQLNRPESQDGALFNALGGWTFEGIEGLSEAQGVKQSGTRRLGIDDTGIISSDGVNLTQEEKIAILEAAETPEAAARALRDAAKAKVPENTILAIMRTSQTTKKAAKKLAERAKIDVTEDEIRTVIMNAETPSQAAQTLIKGAGVCVDETGDDISVIVFRRKNEYLPGGNGTS